LPSSVSRAAMDPTMVTSSPSRIHTVPSPTTIIQWKRDHGSRSMRAGIRVVRVPRPASSAIAVTPSPGRWLYVPVHRRYVVTLRPQITLLRSNRAVPAGTAGAGVRPRRGKMRPRAGEAVGGRDDAAAHVHRAARRRLGPPGEHHRGPRRARGGAAEPAVLSRGRADP